MSSKLRCMATSRWRYELSAHFMMRKFSLLVLSVVATGSMAPLVAHGQRPPSQPVPRTQITADFLELDFSAMEIGVAEYDEGPTGATVFYFPKGVMAAVDVRGGAPATVNTDALRLAYPSAFVDAISFAGGSSYGLSAATGVADAIKTERGKGGAWGSIATVAGAIIFDLGGRRFNTVTPDYDLGRAAFSARRANRFPLGAHGAGRFTTQGGFFGDGLRQHSGQGGAFRQIGQTKIAVFTIVNSLGTIVGRDGMIIRCGRDSAKGCGNIADRIRARTDALGSRSTADVTARNDGVTSNTTLTLVVTNQKLPYWALQRLAVQVHTSLARAIQPFSTENDGDVLFVVTTGEVENGGLSAPDLGVVASEVAWDAVLSSVPKLPEYRAPGFAVDARTLRSYAGEYSLSPTVGVVVRPEGQSLFIEAPMQAGIYLPKGATVELFPVSADEFIIGNPRGDRIRFERAGGRTTGFTINPDRWPVRATRK